MTMVFDAFDLSRAWLSVAVSGEDAESPVLYRTVLVESFPKGVRLISTDGWILIHAWVPLVDFGRGENPRLSMPALHRKPAASVIVADHDGRVGSFMKWLRSETNGQPEGKAEPVDVDLLVKVDNSDSGVFAGMEPKIARFEVVGKERITASTVDAVFPNWRDLVTRRPGSYERLIGAAEPVEGLTVGFGPFGVLRLGGMAKLWGGAPLRCSLFGPMDPVAFTVESSLCAIEGIAMPVRLAGNDDPTPPGVIDPSEPADLALETEVHDPAPKRGRSRERLAHAIGGQVDADGVIVVDAADIDEVTAARAKRARTGKAKR